MSVFLQEPGAGAALLVEVLIVVVAIRAVQPFSVVDLVGSDVLRYEPEEMVSACTPGR